MSKRSTKPPSGFRDFLPADAFRRTELVRLISEVYRSFGFGQLITSAVENIETLRGDGGEENEKLIFQILKRGEKLDSALANNPSAVDLADLGLRFDLTVPLCRVVSDRRADLQLPAKVFQIGSVWRAERPQKGRFREFTQCDVDIVGCSGLGAELEVIQAVATAVYRVSGEKFDLHLNDREFLQALADKFGFEVGGFALVLDKKGKIPDEVLKQEFQDLALGRSFPKELESILHGDFSLENASTFNPKVVERLSLLIDQIKKLQLPLNSIVFDPSLARGMGYYTGSIFELRHRSAGYSLGGGGRYDQLIGKFSNVAIPACGFSIGFDRLLLLMEEHKSLSIVDDSRLFVPVFHPNLRVEVSQLAARIREKIPKLLVDIYPEDAKLKVQFKYASDRHFKYVLIVGEDELKVQIYKLKNLETGQEETVPAHQLFDVLARP